MTLVEMLVAMTASLILFGAVLTIFQILGDAVSRSRRTGRLDSDMCSLRVQLQQDLAGITANRDAKGLLCEVDSGSVNGYFEIIEGPNTDLIDFSVSPAFDRSLNVSGPSAGSNDCIVGDTDDMLFFTTRSAAREPFIGKSGTRSASSTQAEVAYFCTPRMDTQNPRLYSLHRRQLLITGGTTTTPFTNWSDFYASSDVSVRREIRSGSATLVENNANDLQRRRNRFGHDFPGHAADQPPFLYRLKLTANDLRLQGTRENEDVIATNVLAFDVRVLDPLAVERQGPNTLRLQPGDDLYATAANVATNTSVYGDLGFNSFVAFRSGSAAPGIFSQYGRLGHVLIGSATTSRTYDTWTSFYRSNNEDDDDDGGPDNAAERAPYGEQLAGIQVVLRLYDIDTRTVKQATITTSFRK